MRFLVFLAVGCGSLPVVIEPVAPVFGRDALTCVADGEVRWVSGERTHDGKVLPAEVARLGKEWICEAKQGGRRGSASVVPQPLGGNLLVFLLDDIGVDRIGVYDSHPNPVATPVIDQLARSGARFERAWSTPVCSPTRATLMTGRLPFRNGLGRIIDDERPNHILVEEEVFLPELLSAAVPPYTSSMSGKWHLSGRLPDQLDHPSRAAGFAFHSGPVENLQAAVGAVPAPRNYFHWEENDNGTLVELEGYATTHQAEVAVSQIETLPEPWFLYVPFSGAHIPLHRPPDEAVYTPPAEDTQAAHHRAMVESVDLAIGRVLDALSPEVRARTTVFVIGDNGTREDLPDPPLANGKGTVHEDGVRVPFIVNGPAVTEPGVVLPALVHTVDLFDTFAAMAGVDLEALDTAEWGHPRDSVSFLPALGDATYQPRALNYTEWFFPNGPGPYEGYQQGVTDGRFKLMTWEGEPLEEPVRFYDLSIDPEELENLLLLPLSEEHQAVFERLSAALDVERPYDL